MLENIRLSFRGIFSHKMRSFLTMLGIIIGIAAIIAIVSTIKGTNDQIQKNLIGAGKNNVTIRLVQGDWDYDFTSGIPSGIPVMTEDTYESLKGIKNVNGVSLYRRRNEYEGVYHISNSLSGGYVYGVDNDYFATTGLVSMRGRTFSRHDQESYARVCILDEDSVQSLFQSEDPIGKTIEIKKEPFTVIGVVTEAEAFEPAISSLEDYYMYHQSNAGKVYIPQNIWPLVYQYDEPQNAVLQAASTEAMTQVGKDAEKLLNDRLNVQDDSLSYKAEDLLTQAREYQQLSQSTNAMLIWIAGISLLVGGIGVMNIMLVSVTERTSEIGLKKAIGAGKNVILGQFLTEAVVLTSTGGLLGVISGIVLAELISRFNGTPVAISVEAAVFAVLFSMAIGIIFGLLPSYKAANLDPIEALRHE